MFLTLESGNNLRTSCTFLREIIFIEKRTILQTKIYLFSFYLTDILDATEINYESGYNDEGLLIVTPPQNKPTSTPTFPTPVTTTTTTKKPTMKTSTPSKTTQSTAKTSTTTTESTTSTTPITSTTTRLKAEPERLTFDSFYPQNAAWELEKTTTSKTTTTAATSTISTLPITLLATSSTTTETNHKVC